MPATAVPPSTAPKEESNPLAESLSKITGGRSPLSRDPGTSTGVIGYDPEQAFRPTGDAISIAASPGTGASTAETWAHDIALENLKKSQLEFEFNQQQANIANALKQQEAAQSAALAPYQLAQAKQAVDNAKYDTALKQAQAEAAQAQTYQQLGGMSVDQWKNMKSANDAYNAWLGGKSGTATGMQDQYARYLSSGGGTNQTPISQRSTQQLDMYGQPVNHGLAYGQTYYGK